MSNIKITNKVLEFSFGSITAVIKTDLNCKG